MNAGEQARAVRRGAGLFALPERGLAAVRGDDRVRWLNGMLSNDVASLGAPPARGGCYAARLTRQGRIVADVHVVWRPEAFWLETAREAVPGLLEDLDRFLVADDVELEDASAGWERLALEGPRAGRVLAAAGAPCELAADDAAAVRLGHAEIVVAAFGWSGEPALQLFVPAGSAQEVADLLRRAAERDGTPLVEGGREALEILRVEAGVPLLGTELGQDVLPDEAHLEHAISTTKGCYTGQEVVARLRSRGQVAHRLVGIVFDADHPAPAGARLRDGDKAVGEVTSSCVSPECGAIGLGFVRRAAAEPGRALDADGVRATVAELPFPPAARADRADRGAGVALER